MSYSDRIVSAPMLEHEVIVRYLALRKAGLIGQLWCEGDGCFFLAPVDAHHGYNERRPIGHVRLTELISSIHLVEAMPDRKPVESERQPAARAICAA
jgi:hypothetical protein